MYAGDHFPPHFHARFAEFIAQISIETGEIITGDLPKNKLRLVQAWNELHRDELMFNWGEVNKPNPDIKKVNPIQ